MTETGSAFLQSDWFNYLILPFLIFLARICDVSIGTLRIIFVAKGNKLVAPFLGFFEVLIWILAITRIIQNLDNPFCYLGYAAGFATGNYIGLLIEEKLAMGVVMLRIITLRPIPELIEKLNKAGYGSTQMNADGTKGKVFITFTIIPRSELNTALGFVREIEPDAFITTEDIRMVSKGVFPASGGGSSKINPFKWWRKGI
jgi:uncharacterized protein YebE (UPF0316 family)